MTVQCTKSYLQCFSKYPSFQMIFESDENIKPAKSDITRIPKSSARPMFIRKWRSYSNFETDVDYKDQSNDNMYLDTIYYVNEQVMRPFELNDYSSSI